MKIFIKEYGLTILWAIICLLLTNLLLNSLTLLKDSIGSYSEIEEVQKYHRNINYREYTIEG